jgi:hypothetical protein
VLAVIIRARLRDAGTACMDGPLRTRHVVSSGITSRAMELLRKKTWMLSVFMVPILDFGLASSRIGPN